MPRSQSAARRILEELISKASFETYDNHGALGLA